MAKDITPPNEPEPKQPQVQDDPPKHAGGAPLKYETPELLDRAINAYFAMCDPHTQRRVVDCGINEQGETLARARGHD